MSLIAAAGALALAVGSRSACDGRYVVRDPAGALAPTVVALSAGRVTLEPACDSVRAKLQRARTGWRLAAHWARCGATRAVRLRATLATDCTLLSGRLTARHLPRASLTATVSACGDGFLDAGHAEECDDGNLLGGDTCNPLCRPCDPVADAPTSTWDGVRTNVIARYGCPRCHNPGGVNALDLRPEVAYANLVGVPSGSAPGLLLVDPGDESRSLAFLKLAKGAIGVGYDEVPGSGMPYDGSLTAEELREFGLWIRAGAPETGVVPDTATLLTPCRPR